MIYQHLFKRAGTEKIVRAGVIGTGNYATAVVTQSAAIPGLEIVAVADIDADAARRAYRRAGYADGDIAICESRDAALQAVEQGRRAVLADALLLVDLPVDVVVESTGVPEAGAKHALEAIRHGKHVAMVNKEADVTVGPILKHLADREGVVYTAVDGDQHGLIMGLTAWARELGMEVLCAGKFSNAELVFDADAGTISRRNTPVPLDADGADSFGPVAPGQVPDFVRGRKAVLGALSRADSGAMAEMTIAANATGLAPDVETLHYPAIRTVEIPEVLCPVGEGGILRRRGAIELVTCLRHPHEAGMGGGVFMVVACANDHSRNTVMGKGLIPNSRGTAAVIPRPYHLCGVETPISILCAGLLGVATGAADYLPRFDAVAQAERDMVAGEVVGNHAPGFRALMRPAVPVEAGAALPLHMLDGNTLAADIPAGTVVTADMVAAPEDSALWSLRAQQDVHFLKGGDSDGRS